MRKRRTGWRFRDGVRVVPHQRDFTEAVRFAYGVVDAMGRPIIGRASPVVIGFCGRHPESAIWRKAQGAPAASGGNQGGGD